MPNSARIGIDAPEFQLRSGSLRATLRFAPDALSALILEIGTGFVSIPRRGAEVGGILEGEITQDGPAWSIAVERVIPVPIQYQYGPSFRLTPGDKQRFRERIESSGPRAALIGWYRSNTRPQHEADDSDRQMSRTLFLRPQSVFLLCEPSAEGRISATLVIMLPEQTEVAFPFELGRFSRVESLLHKDELECAEQAAHAFPKFREIGVEPVPERRLQIEHRFAPRRERNFSIRRVVVVAAVILGIAAAGSVARRRPPNVPADRSVPVSAAARADDASLPILLGLRAEYQGNAVLIGRDRASPPVASARSAVFTIADGDRTRTLNLSARELRTGSILYTADADEISVVLDVNRPPRGSRQRWMKNAAPQLVEFGFPSYPR